VNCQQFEHYLDAYLDEELEGTLKREFEVHLVDCESCGHLYAMMEAVGQIVAEPDVDEPQLRADFTDRVMVGIADRQMKNLRVRKIIAASSVAAAIALILTGLVFFTSIPSAPVVSPSSSMQIVQTPVVPEPAFMAVNDLPAESIQDKPFFDIKSTFAKISKPTPAMAAAAGQALEQQQAQEELNQWLAVKLERAGSSLWEITQLRAAAWSQMRQGFFKSLASPLRPVDSYFSADSVMPLIPSRLDGINEYAPMPQDNVSLEAGVELL
jgi:hypothetical protein